MALLDVKDLTMRFGGLTAVCRLNLRVDSGQIFSVIGPNGAGKTTVFNAVTGIYEPTEGNIDFNGRELKRPITWRLWIAAICVGLLTAITAALLCSEIDGLWHATIERNYDFANQQFNSSEATRDLWEYLRGELAIESLPRNRFAIVTTDGQALLGGTTAAIRTTREAAEHLMNDLRELIQAGKTIEPVERGNRWAILSADDERTLVTYASKESADRIANSIAGVHSYQIQRQRTLWIALIGGFVLGVAGSYVIWNRGRRTPDVIARAGIARTFQNIRLFAEMSVLENVLVALDQFERRSVLPSVFATSAKRNATDTARKKAIDLLRFVGLDGKSYALASSLAYGDQRRLEIARALATDPKLLLLDEPAAGMNPAETSELVRLIRRIQERGVTVLLIEHHMNVVMGISNQIAVLDYGQKIAEGAPMLFDAIRK